MSEQLDGDVPDWDLPDRMRKALRHAGMSPGQMARYLGVTRQSVGNWISGRVDPSFQTVRLWSIRTGTDLEWLLVGETALAQAGSHISTNLTTLIPRDASVTRVRAALAA